MSDTVANDRAYEHIRAQLLSGELPAGVRVSDLTLSKKIGMSRTPVREAINRLASEGFVERVPPFGAFVKSPTRIDLEELFELRELLEGHAAFRAAINVTAAELTELEALCRKHREVAGEVKRSGLKVPEGPLAQRFVLTDLAFHMLLQRASGNGRLQKIIGNGHVMTHIFSRKCTHPGLSFLAAVARSYRHHLRIVQALARRDQAGAREQMRAHVRWAAKWHLAGYDWSERRASSGADATWSRQLQRQIDEMERGSDAGAAVPRPAGRARRAPRR